jgi:hypothetical protein
VSGSDAQVAGTTQVSLQALFRRKRALLAAIQIARVLPPEANEQRCIPSTIGFGGVKNAEEGW